MSGVAPVRRARFAGSWYPGEKAELARDLEAMSGQARKRERALAVLSPHAGYRYSGAIAAETFAQVEVPAVAIVLCPNHRVPPPVVSVWPSGAWQTPLGDALIDDDLVGRLLAECKAAHLAADTYAHEQEHAVELQVPLLQRNHPGVRLVPIVVAESPSRLQELGEGLARAIQGRDDVLLVASTDLNHYESQAIAEKKDRLALDHVLALDPLGLLETCDREDISMCGVQPTAAVLWAAKALGAKRAMLVRHATSGDVSGDYESVVGYAGVVVG